jgi:competence protein ComEC
MEGSLNKARIIYSILFGFLFGVAVAPFLGVSIFTALWFALLALILGFSLFVSLPSELSHFVFIVIFFIAAALGVARFQAKDTIVLNPALEQSVGGKVSMTGEVANYPEGRESNTRIILKLEEPETRVLVWAPHYPEVSYGDYLEVIGTLKKPEMFATDAGGVFNYPEYLAKDGIYYEISFADVEIVGHGGGNRIVSVLFGVRKSFSEALERVIKEPESSLARGILLGERSGLGEELEDSFRTSGIVHIIVLSGYNIAIVAAVVLRFFSKLPKRAALLLAAIGIVLFAVMVGGGATVMRATIFALFVLLAKSQYRNVHVGRALLLVASLMVAMNPKIIFYDPSFQLSFLATVGLIWFSPKILGKLRFVKGKLEFLKEIIGTTIATQIMVLPWILHLTGNLPVFSLPVNAVVLPLIPFVMLSSFVSAVLGLISTSLAFPFAIVSQTVLQFVIFVSKEVSQFEFSAILFKPFPIFLTALIYAVIWALMYQVNVRTAISKLLQNFSLPHPS